MSDNVDIWLWLVLVMGANNLRLGKILGKCGYNPAKAGVVIRDNKDPSLTAAELSRAKSIRSGAVREYKRFCEASGVSIIAYGSEDYPVLLKKIENPPPVLFALGDVSGLNEKPALAVVGTRNISDYGISAVNHLVKPLAKAGAVIVSGIALGADRAAHEACLDAGGRTLAFPGCGVLENHPRENEDLKKRILENGGAVISELLPDRKAELYYFRRRDAIMSGVCRGTLVIEAGEKSGSLITASCAKEQRRAVFAVPPHDISSGAFLGNARLIRGGAVCASDFSDIASVLGVKAEKPGYTKSAAEAKKAGSAKKTEEPEKPAVQNKPEKLDPHRDPVLPSYKSEPEKGIYVYEGVLKTFEEIRQMRPKNHKDRSVLSPQDRRIVDYLDNGPAYLETIIEDLDMDYYDAMEALMMLEMNGYTQRENGGVYHLK